MAGSLVTWAEVMDLVKELDRKRSAGERVTERDADRLVTMLLAFHKGVVCALPTSEAHPERIDRAAGSGRR